MLIHIFIVFEKKIILNTVSNVVHIFYKVFWNFVVLKMALSSHHWNTDGKWRSVWTLNSLYFPSFADKRDKTALYWRTVIKRSTRTFFVLNSLSRTVIAIHVFHSRCNPPEGINYYLLIFSFLRFGNKAKARRWVPPRNVCMCISCCMRDTVWNWF